MESPTRKRVLVVDDDVDLRQLVRTLLESVGIETIAAASASEAAQILRTALPLPDLLLLDLMLPDVSGLELLRQMRARTMFDDLPVVILSAIADPDQIRDGLNAGADRYITKPYISSNLIKVVQEVLRTGRRRTE